MSFDSIFPIALLVFVVVAYTIHSIQVFRLARATARWPVTDGVVVDASLGERSDGDSVRFTANVRYRYSVRGQSFESTRLSMGIRSYSYHSWAAQALRGVHKGETVDVYYDPAKPGRAVLLTGHHAEHIHAFIGCAVGWLAVLFFVFTAVLNSQQT